MGIPYPHIAAAVHSSDYMNVVLLFGIILLGGAFASRLFQLVHIPQVVGCIVIGVVIGDVLHVVTPQTIEHLEPFAMFALGIIGFMIGGELRVDLFKRYGRQFFVILLAEGFGAFLLVGVATSAVAYAMTSDSRAAAAIGLLLGAIASATAPAATVNVLWEFKTRGPLTATILAIVALDDALALLLYRGAATGAKAVLGTTHDSPLVATGILFAEIITAVALGAAAGGVLYLIMKIIRAEDKILAFSLSSLLVVVGIAMIPGIDPILPAMTLGITIANALPRQSRNIFKLIERFSPPIYISFFVLAGAHIAFRKLGPWVLALIAVYVVCRVIGKVFGAAIGATCSGAAPAVARYLGICLQAQAGVAIGLAVLAGQQFNSGVGSTVVIVVMTATFVAEILGPVLVKVGVKKAGEVGLNVTESDLITSYNVAEVMDADAPVIDAGHSLTEVVAIVGNTRSSCYPVLDAEKKLVGTITLDGIRNTFANEELNSWLIALDIVEPVIATLIPQTLLADALEESERLDLEQIPVVTAADNTYAGILDTRAVRRRLSAEVLSRQQKADTMHMLQSA